MKTKLVVIAMLSVFLLTACKEEEKPAPQQSTPTKDSTPQKQSPHSQEAKTASSDSHTVVVQEAIHGNSYTYLSVKEGSNVFWIAITKTKIDAGETISFANGLEMKNFTSKEIQKTFETIYFVGSISKDASPSTGHGVMSAHQQKPVEKKKIAIEPAKGGITIEQLFANSDAYGGKVVKIKGQVTKVNRAIMGKNWVHLQDGTGSAGSNDLLVTTNTEVAVGDVVTFEGTIALDKNFGAGYVYKVLMEKAKKAD